MINQQLLHDVSIWKQNLRGMFPPPCWIYAKRKVMIIKVKIRSEILHLTATWYSKGFCSRRCWRELQVYFQPPYSDLFQSRTAAVRGNWYFSETPYNFLMNSLSCCHQANSIVTFKSRTTRLVNSFLPQGVRNQKCEQNTSRNLNI